MICFSKMALLCIFFVASFANAQSSSTSVDASAISSSAGAAAKYDPTTPYNSDFKRIDQLLGNRVFKDDYKLSDLRLRAEDGSLSRYSLKGSMSFLGPVLSNPAAPDQPNPDHTVGNYSQALRGSAMARYRFDSDSALNFGTGVSFNHPFQGMDRTDASNPFVSYSHSARFGNLQMITLPGLTYATVPEMTAVGEIGGAMFNTIMIYGLGQSRYALSLDVLGAYWFFNRGYNAGSGMPTPGGFGRHRGGGGSNPGDGYVVDYNIAYSPGVKYTISDHFDCSGGLNFSFRNPRQMNDQTVLWNSTPRATIGLGYAYDRDIYIGPFIQTYPTIMSADTTTINVSTVFSLL